MDNLPLRIRFRAWWEGYEVADLRRILSRPNQSDSVREVAFEPAPKPRVTVERQTAARTATPTPAGWRPEQIAAGEIVFGERSLSPRCDDQLKSIAVSAGLGVSSQVLHLGGELGGVATLLERGLGCTVVAAETLPELVAASGGRVLPLSVNDGAKQQNTDLVLVDGLAERGEPLATLLRNQCSSLTPGGVVVLRTLVIADERAADSMRFREWANTEPARPRLRSTEELTRILQEARLAVVGVTSTSDEYAQEVERCWGVAIDRIRELHRDPVGRTVLPVLLDECERWRRRIELVRDGVIGVRQFTARRRERGRV